MFSRNISFKVEPCGTSPYIWNTLIQGTTPFRGYKILSWKNVQIIFVPVISDWRDTFFWVQKPGLTSPQETHSKNDWPQKALIILSLHFSEGRQFSQDGLSHLNWCTSLVGMQHTITQPEINFTHHLSAWNNNCSRSRDKIKEKYFICWLIINKPQPNLR